VFSEAVVDSDCQNYQGLKVLFQFPRGQFILDGVEQSAGCFLSAEWVVEDSSQLGNEG
jgi:hypothetical protein